MRRFASLTATLLIGMILVSAAPCFGQEIEVEDEGLYSTRRLSAAIMAGSDNRLVIRAAASLRGRLTISVAEINAAELTYRKKARSGNKKRAVDYIDLIAVSLDSKPNEMRLELRAPNPPPWSGDDYGLVDAEIVVPVGCQVEIAAAYFDVEAAGPFKTFVNNSSLGRIEVSSVTAAIDVSTANQRVLIEDVHGEVSASTTNATLTARRIEATDSNASFRNEGGDIKIDDCRGGLTVKNSYGRIRVDDFSPGDSKSHVRGDWGPITVEINETFTGSVVLKNRHEDIVLDLPAELSAQIGLSVEEGGRIEAEGFEFRTDLVTPNRLGLVAAEGEGVVSASVRGKGNIYVRGSE